MSRLAALIAAMLLLGFISRSQQLILQNSVLLYSDGRRVVRLDQLLGAAEIRGYSMIDSHHAFVAFQPKDESEAVTHVCIVTLPSKHIQWLIRDLGGTGDHFFAYNPAKRLLAMAASDGIQVAALPPSGRLQRNAPQFRFVKRFVLLQGQITPYWIDSRTLGWTTTYSDSTSSGTIRIQ